MRLLWQRGAVPVKNIGAALALDYGTLSPLLKRLETRGLIRRVRRSDDEPSVEIEPPLSRVCVVHARGSGV
jgi:MarR family transcriptional regulator, organic hydroperoxide resistance regulator